MIHLLWLSLAIPVAIHLVHRRKARQVPFSTLRFLRMVDQRVARRQRLKEFLLLALRLLLLAALIGALYRPMVRSATFKGTNVPTAVAIVLDNTYSMRTAAGGALRFERAKAAARHVLGGLQRGDTAVILPFVPAGDEPPEPTTAIEQLGAELDALECGYGTGDVEAPLRRALGALAGSSNPRREVYLITDFQRKSWTPAVTELAAGVPRDVPVFLVDVGGDVGENLTLTEAAFARDVHVAGAESVLSCRLRNTGSLNVEKELALYVDGEKTDARTVSLAAGAEATAAFSHVFSRAGDASAEVRLEADELAADNARYLTARVQDSLPVLLVNGDPSGVPYLNETFFLELALRAPSPVGRQVSPVEPTVVAPAELLRRRLEDFGCVVLANLPQVSDVEAERLRRYVEAGGGLIVFVGDRTDPASYNAALCPAGEEPLLPALLGERVDAPEGGFRIRSLARQHPAFAGLAEQLDIAPARVSSFLSVTPHEGRDAATVLAELDDGPLILERKAGAGIVLLVTSSADLDWNNLAARGLFLPLIHQMVYYAARSARASESLLVGSPYVLDLPPSDEPAEVAIHGPRAAGEEGEPAPPDVVTSTSADGARKAVFTGTWRPGLYRAVWQSEGGEQVRHFAVNVDARESDSARIEPEEAARMLAGAACRVVLDPDALASIVRREREGLPLWDYLFALALAFAVAESFVGNVALKH